MPRDLDVEMSLLEAVRHLKARASRRCDGDVLGWNLDDVTAVKITTGALTDQREEHDDKPGD